MIILLILIIQILYKKSNYKDSLYHSVITILIKTEQYTFHTTLFTRDHSQRVTSVLRCLMRGVYQSTDRHIATTSSGRTITTNCKN